MHEVSKEMFKTAPLLDSIDSLVLDYLLHQGHHSTFTSLPFKNFNSNSSANTTTLLHRSQVIKLIKHGRIIDVLNFIQTNFLSVPNKINHVHKNSLTKLTSSKSLPVNQILSINQILFLLNLQHFIELLRTKNTLQAVSWVQSELIPRTKENPDLQIVLEEALGVLAYCEPEQSSMAWIFDQKHRYSILASLTNSTLLSISPDFDYLLTNNSSSASSSLETFIKHVKSLDHLVHDLQGFPNELDNQKWSTLHDFIDLDNQRIHQSRGDFIKMIKNE